MLHALSERVSPVFLVEIGPMSVIPHYSLANGAVYDAATHTMSIVLVLGDLFGRMTNTEKCPG